MKPDRASTLLPSGHRLNLLQRHVSRGGQGRAAA